MQPANLGSGESGVSSQTAVATIPLHTGSRLSPFLALLFAAMRALVFLFCSCLYFSKRRPPLTDIARPRKQVLDLSWGKVDDPIKELTECVLADISGLLQ
jgi:uncharacterized iron-regulated membrane protein